MSINTAYEYLQQKKALLKQCLTLSEELISSIKGWEAVPEIVSKREAVIQQLKELEESTGASIKASLTKEMKQELDQMIKLILDLDKDATSLIRGEQKGIMDSLKANTKEQKLVQYAQTLEIASGRKLNYKK
jgi:hypothetical protein